MSQGHQQVMNPNQATTVPAPSSCMLRRRRTMELGSSLALPLPEEDDVPVSGEEVEGVKDGEGMEKEMK